MAAGSRVVVAMSGGVDSSVAAALLVEAGHDVVGVFMRQGSPESGGLPILPATKPGHQGCCSVADALDARRVADRLGIPLYPLDLTAEFGRIIDYFAAEYGRGRTPNPCVRCNAWLKFGRLFDHADAVGAGHVATGHYARLEAEGNQPPRLRRGLETARDQSYFLFDVPRERLSRMLLPIGGLTKAEVRTRATALGLATADKPDSQEICFVAPGEHAALVGRPPSGHRALHGRPAAGAGDRKRRAAVRGADRGRYLPRGRRAAGRGAGGGADGRRGDLARRPAGCGFFLPRAVPRPAAACAGGGDAARGRAVPRPLHGRPRGLPRRHLSRPARRLLQGRPAAGRRLDRGVTVAKLPTGAAAIAPGRKTSRGSAKARGAYGRRGHQRRELCCPPADFRGSSHLVAAQRHFFARANRAN
jgi:hypothetical protein